MENHNEILNKMPLKVKLGVNRAYIDRIQHTLLHI